MPSFAASVHSPQMFVGAANGLPTMGGLAGKSGCA
jgi:hypothetical protein